MACPGVGKNSPIHLQFLEIGLFFFYIYTDCTVACKTRHNSGRFYPLPYQTTLSHLPHPMLSASVHTCRLRKQNRFWKTEAATFKPGFSVGLPVYQRYGLEICFKSPLCWMTVREGHKVVLLLWGDKTEDGNFFLSKYSVQVLIIKNSDTGKRK